MERHFVENFIDGVVFVNASSGTRTKAKNVVMNDLLCVLEEEKLVFVKVRIDQFTLKLGQ